MSDINKEFYHEIWPSIFTFDYSKIVNLTPHDINILKLDGDIYKEIVTIPASGYIARLHQSTSYKGYLGDIPITTTVFGDITGLPDYDGVHMYVVSYPIAKRLHEIGNDRKDIFITNQSVRDEKGRIIGCESLAIV